MSLARDSWLLFLSEGTSAALTVAIGFLLARLLPLDVFGGFMAAYAFAGLLAVVADSGMGLLAAKETAADATGASDRLSEIFTWRLAMIVAACALGPLLAPLALPAGEARRLGAWLTPGVMLVALADFFGWILKGRRRIPAAAVIQVGTRALLIALCGLSLAGGPALRGVLAAFWLAGAAALAVGPVLVARNGVPLRPVRLARDFFSGTGRSVTKIGAVVVLSVAFTRLDLLLVSGLLGAAAAGLFGAAGRVVDALRLVPTVSNAALLPRFSAHRDRPVLFRRQFLSAYGTLLTLGVGLALAAAAGAAPLLARAFGPSYAAAAPVLRPLAWSAVPMFLNMLGFSALYAVHDHRPLILGIAAALALELVLDAALLPRVGIAAAGWARLAAEGVNLIVLLRAALTRGWLVPWDLLRPAIVLAVVLAGLRLLDGRAVFQTLGAVAGLLALFTSAGRRLSVLEPAAREAHG